MKKFLGIIAIMMALSMAFAQNNSSDEEGASMDTSVQVIVPEDMHTTNKTAQVRIEYIAALDEVRIYYTCLEVSFKEGEARETIHACLNDFQLERNYYGYKYMKQDRLSYKKNARGLKQATYACQVKFQR
ncbi:MAG: hypothetical protein K6A42_07250 [Treponema sp.]|nr:hypothetical protein [Treponema sp.]